MSGNERLMILGAVAGVFILVGRFVDRHKDVVLALRALTSAIRDTFVRPFLGKFASNRFFTFLRYYEVLVLLLCFLVTHGCMISGDQKAFDREQRSMKIVLDTPGKTDAYRRHVESLEERKEANQWMGDLVTIHIVMYLPFAAILGFLWIGLLVLNGASTERLSPFTYFAVLIGIGLGFAELIVRAIRN